MRDGDQRPAHRFIGVAKYLQLTSLHVSLCGGSVHLQEVVVLICEALLNVEVCFLPSHNGSYSAEAALTLELQGHLQMLWLFCCGYICSFVGSVFFYFRSEGNFSPLEFFFFFFFCSKSGWEFIKVNLLLSWFFFSKFRIFCSVNIGSIICAITWNF